ncbi:SLAC1 anion channel family protein [bacterium]|nr:SLAC1 anion channel family protein [bacterium]
MRYENGGDRLENLPITLFGSVMGLAGLSIAWLRYGEIMHRSTRPGQVLLYLTAAWFLLLTLFYLLKCLRFPGRVAQEWCHPVRVNFFPAFSISILLLGIGFFGLRPELSRVLWWIGMPLHMLGTLRIIALWIRGDMSIHSLNPAWFIPVVGTILVPVAGAQVAHPDISWFFFAVGLIFWIIFMTIVFYRLIFHPPLPEKLLPTLSILIAPPSVGFIAWMKLTGSLDPAARMLYFFGLFIFLLILGKARRFIRLPYFVSWWAYTFPMASVTLSSLLMHKLTGLAFYAWLGTTLLALTSFVVLVVLAKTLRAAGQRRICVEEI